MNADEITTAIRSRRRRLEDGKLRAINAIREGDWWAAQIALGECVGHSEVIDELGFQLDVIEVEGE